MLLFSPHTFLTSFACASLVTLTFASLNEQVDASSARRCFFFFLVSYMLLLMLWSMVMEMASHSFKLSQLNSHCSSQHQLDELVFGDFLKCFCFIAGHSSSHI